MVVVPVEALHTALTYFLYLLMCKKTLLLYWLSTSCFFIVLISQGSEKREMSDWTLAIKEIEGLISGEVCGRGYR